MAVMWSDKRFFYKICAIVICFVSACIMIIVCTWLVTQSNVKRDQERTYTEVQGP